MSSIRDRVKQTATVASYSGGLAVYSLEGGANIAELGFRDVRNGYDIPTIAGRAVFAKMMQVPVFIEKGSEWLIARATIKRDATGPNGVLTLEVDNSSPAVVVASSASTTSLFTVSNTVTIAVVPSQVSFGDLAVWTANEPDSVDRLQDGTNAWHGILAAGGIAHGDNSVAIGGTVSPNHKYGVAIGSNALCGVGGGSSKHCVVIGAEASAYHPGSVSLGVSSWASTPGGLCHGVKDVGINVGGMRDIWQGHQVVLMQAKTANATPGVMTQYEALSAGAEIARAMVSDFFWVDAGVQHYVAIISATDVATEDKKVWKMEFATKNIEAYGAAALLGSVTKTVIGADAGAAAWDVGVTIDVPNDKMQLSITGEAAKNILWQANVTGALHTYY